VAAWLLGVVCVVSYALAAYTSPVVGAAGALALFAALQLVESSVVPIVLATAGPWLAGRVVRSRQQLVAALEKRTAELTTEQEAFARLSVRRERARIARELHDIVAHHLAVMVIQAGAGRVGSQDDGDTAQRLHSIRQSGDHALAEMDRLVAMLQSDSHEDGGGERLQLLLDQVQATGLELRATRIPPDMQLPADVEEGVYRVVQEGLTNAMKHAPGSAVQLRLVIRAGTLEIELLDSGGEAPSELARTGGGHGLAGMRERIAALGGTFEAGPVGGGWRVSARVPTG
jgi:signal transduction histidine kinase